MFLDHKLYFSRATRVHVLNGQPGASLLNARSPAAVDCEGEPGVVETVQTENLVAMEVSRTRLFAVHRYSIKFIFSLVVASFV